ncbi:multiubiquitin domain-containing protein [Limnobacter sp. P1]|uniref:multiubiquitin domain-containing protein n=1 Tax=Limnobacter olei TaxID=3031298 RepID=UPI0023B0D4C9|nr:multiubiquitin domain-containing protein [Limnobacter sp. P1]
MQNSNSDNAPGQNKIYTIIINGRQREVTGQRISYRQVVELAFPDDQANDAIEYTVAYANPHGKDGTLVSEQETHLKQGMIFNVSKTNRS